MPPAGEKPVWRWCVRAAAACGMRQLSLAAAAFYKEPQSQTQSRPLRTAVHLASITSGLLVFFFFFSSSPEPVRCDPSSSNESDRKTMKERRNTQPLVVRCKLVLVGDVQCGKTAMLQVLAKDCYPEVITENPRETCAQVRAFLQWVGFR